MLRAGFRTVVAVVCLSGLQGLAQDSMWLDVPFVPQPRDGCGAASLSMVMRYWAAQKAAARTSSSEVETIQRVLYSPSDHGIPAPLMAPYLKQHGFLAFSFNGRWSDLEEHLSKGRPLIVALRPEGDSQLHYVVLDGIDTEHGLVVMNDPADRKLLKQERAEFEKQWSATHNWVLLAVPAPSSH